MNRFTGRLGAAFFMLASITSAFAGGNTTTNVPNTGTTAVAGFTCFSSQFCTGHVNINNTGTEIFTSGNPGRFDPTGATTQPVSGTFWQATQPVSGTFWQATQPVSGTFFQATQPVSIAGTVATSAALGSFVDGASVSLGAKADAAYAGSGDATLIAIMKGLYALTNTSLIPSAPLVPGTAPSQGVAVLCYNGSTPTVGSSQTAALQCNSTGQLITTAGAVAQGSTTSGQTGTLIQGAVTTAAPSYTTAQTSPLSLDTAGNLRVNVVAGSAANAAASATGAAVPSAADYHGVNVVGTGLVGVTGETVTSHTSADTNLQLVNGAAVATGHGTAATSVRVELPTDGTGQVAISQASPGTSNGVSPVLTTGGGWTPLRLAALTNTATSIKGSTGQLGMLYCFNPNATVVYAQIYNTASGGVTVGSTAAVLTLGIPATSNGGFPMSFPGVQFSTAISVALTTTATGGSAPATAVDCSAAFN